MTCWSLQDVSWLGWAPCHQAVSVCPAGAVVTETSHTPGLQVIFQLEPLSEALVPTNACFLPASMDVPGMSSPHSHCWSDGGDYLISLSCSTTYSLSGLLSVRHSEHNSGGEFIVYPIDLNLKSPSPLSTSDFWCQLNDHFTSVWFVNIEIIF